MKNSITLFLRHAMFIAASFLLMTLSFVVHPVSASAAADSKTYVATAANGDKIPNPISGATYTVKDVTATVKVPEGMVYIPEGSFVMGSGKTAHTVRLSGYCIGKFHVTNAEYKVFCDDTGAARPRTWGKTDEEMNAFLGKKGNHPVLGISYVNAMAYCEWMNKKTGWKVTLPSEAQWERAARGATTSGDQNTYPWGNDISYDDYITHLTFTQNLAVMYGKPKTEATYGGVVYDVFWPFVVDMKTGAVINQRAFGHKEDDTKTTDINELSPEARAVWDQINADGGATTPVGSHQPSPAGCYDMAGNAFQWTRDWLTVSYYIELAKKGPDPVIEDESVLTKEDKNAGQPWNRGNGEAATKVVKGGSWYAQKGTAMSTNHAESGMVSAANFVNGFRIVVENPAH